MAVKTPENLRAWASASPEELQAIAGDEPLYTGAAAPEVEETEEEEAPVPGDAEFNPEEIETYAYEIADQLAEGGGEDELVALVDDYDPAEGQPIWAADAELWDGAIDIASDVLDTTDPAYWQLVVHLYAFMQGPIEEPEAELPALPVAKEEGA